MSRLSSIGMVGTFAALLPTLAFAQDVSLLWGEWHLEGASVPFPPGCESIFYRYKPDGTVETRDGNARMTMRYTAKSLRKGLVLHLTYVSDNDLPNCQGLSAKEVRNNNINEALVTFIDGNNRLRVYLGTSEQEPYLVLRKTQ